MHLNWNGAKQKFLEIVNQNGTLIQWLQRTSTGSDAYDISNTSTFGYGDSITYFTTGSIKAVVQHVSATDIIMEIGFMQDDYERIWVDPDTNIQMWDQFLYPSGSSIRYICRTIHDWTMGGVVVNRHIDIRRLVPKSKDAY